MIYHRSKGLKVSTPGKCEKDEKDTNNQESPRIKNIGAALPVFQHCTAHWDRDRSPGRCASDQWSHGRQHDAVLKCGQWMSMSQSESSLLLKFYQAKLVMSSWSGWSWDKWCYSRCRVHWLRLRTWRCKVNGSGSAALLVVFLARLTSSKIGIDSAINSFVFIICMILVRIPPENPCVLWWSWKAANVAHGYGSQLSGSLLKQTCYPHKWNISHIEANPIHMTWTYIRLTSSKGRHSRLCKWLFFHIQESEVMIVGPWGGSDVETKLE